MFNVLVRNKRYDILVKWVVCMPKSVYVTVVSLPEPILRDLIQTFLSHALGIWDHRMTAVLVILLVVASSIVGLTYHVPHQLFQVSTHQY